MGFYADLHIHSKYSRATSRDCDLEHLGWWAGRKGITVVGTGDFTHPAWFEELRTKLVPDGDTGLFRLRDDLERERLRRLPPPCRGPVRFMLSVEISTIYKKGDRTRKIHHLIYAPDLETAERLNTKLGSLGNIRSDGRPILGLDSRHLLEIALESGPGAYLIPAHIWTPWFAVLGAMSGFDAVHDCYADLASHVFAVETGLSSDPEMNWRISSLDRYRLVSNSDAHSPPMLGREACVFECEPDYFAMRRALETGTGYGGTVEFFPEEGKYHLDGHRKCSVRLDPVETRARGGACPVCGKRVTVGVMSRVQDLADREAPERPAGAAGFRNLVPLPEIVGEIVGVGPKSKTVERDVATLVDRLGPELSILEHMPIEEIRRAGSPLIEEAIARLRRGEVIREAGYDGEYGVIRMFREDELGGNATAVAVLAGMEAPIVFDGFEPAPAPKNASSRERKRKALPSAVEPTPKAASGSILDALDPDQREAAGVTAGPLLVVAGPGSGKTRTCAHRIAHLVAERGVSPTACLAITFTRRAAEEMRSRLAALLGERASAILVTTFHGLGMRIVQAEHASLGLHRGFRIASEDEQLALVRQIADCTERRARSLLGTFSRARRATSSPLEAEAREIKDRYRAALWERDLVDFDDLIELPVKLLESDAACAAAWRERFAWISIDEYQDVDELQYRLVRQLAPSNGNLCAIGDPDQAIYGFRGADVGFFLRFREDYPGARVCQLVRNYRSSAVIVEGSRQAIAPATLAGDRALIAAGMHEASPNIVVHQAPSDRAEAEQVVVGIERLMGGTSWFSIDSGRVESGEGEHLCFADFAVLYRTDAQADMLVEALQRSGIPFQKRSHERLIDRPGVRALMARLPSEAGDGATVSALLAAIAAGSDSEVLDDEIQAAAELLAPLADRAGSDVEAFLAEIELGAEIDTWDPCADHVSLLTLHAAKGLEFPVVFVVGCEDGLLPLRFGNGPAALDEERRLFFVGMTRARSHLVLSWARRRMVRGQTRACEPSPFLRDIEETLLEHRRSELRARRAAASAGEQLALL